MKPELRESEVERQLARRAAGEWRAGRVLPAVSGATAGHHQARPLPRWAGPVGAATVVALLAVLAVALPALAPGPAATPGPAEQIEVLSTGQFAASLAAGDLHGVTVLVEGRIDESIWRGRTCHPLRVSPCVLGLLSGSNPPVIVLSREAPTTEDDPFRSEVDGEGVEWPWWHTPAVPLEGVLALSVDRFGSVTLVGTVKAEGGGSLGWDPAAVAALAVESITLDELLVVDGWLTQVSGAISGRPPDPGTVLDGLPSNWSGNPAWIGPESAVLDPAGYFEPEGSVRVQNGAMFLVRGDRQAADPVQGRFALVRTLYGGGCPEGDPPCWNWSIAAVLWSSDPGDGPIPPDAATPNLPSPTATGALESPPLAVESPAALTCRPVTRGRDPLDGPFPTLQVLDYTRLAAGCIYIWRPEPLVGDAPIHVEQEELKTIEVTWATEGICDSDVSIELSGDEHGYDMAIDHRQGSACYDMSGVEGFLMWFDEPIDATAIEAYFRGDAQPSPSPSVVPSPPIECEEITAPPSQSNRHGEAVVVDHSGVGVRMCQWFRAVPSDEDQAIVTNPTGSQTLLEIFWPVPFVCDYMPVELGVWRTAEGLLLHIDRKGIINPEMQGCRMVTGRQGVLLNLTEPTAASLVETALTIEGPATSVIDLPEMGLQWTLSLAAGKTVYAADEQIDVEASLEWDGRRPISAAHRRGLFGFGVRQLDGDLAVEPAWSDGCEETRFAPGVPVTREYRDEPDLRLPSGTYLVTVELGGFAAPDTCTPMRDDFLGLDASIVLTVR